MFGRQSNQNGNGVNVNTTIKVFFSDLSTLNIGAWNSQLSLKFVPCTGRDANGMRQYDTNRKASTALYPEKAIALKRGIDDNLLESIRKFENGEAVEEKSVSISMGSNDKKNVLSVELKPDESGKFGIYLTIYQNIKEDNSTDPQNIYSYLFGNNTYVTDYDYRTGKYGKEQEVSSEFETFYQILSNAVDILPIMAHGVRYTNMLSSQFSASKGNNGAAYSNAANDMGGYSAPAASYSGGSEDIGLPWN